MVQKITKSFTCYALLNSVILTILAYGVFWGQNNLSDIVTLATTGDTFLETYPEFIKLISMLNTHTYFGIDVNVFNGAAEQFYKIYFSKNPIVLFFALLGTKFNSLLCYALMFSFEMIIYLFFLQKILFEHFLINKKICFLTAVSAMMLFFANSDFIVFENVSVMTVVSLYFLIKYYKNRTVINLILSTIMLTATYTSGAPIYECLSVLVATICAWVYSMDDKLQCESNLYKLSVIIRPGILASIIVFPYLLQYYLYTKKVSVAFNVINLANATEYCYKFSDILGAILYSYKTTSGFERVPYFTVGALWFVAMFVLVRDELYKNITKYLPFLKTVIGINLLLLLLAAGKTLPMAAWFFSFVPLLGVEHLQIRLGMISIPLLMLSLGICYQYLPNKSDSNVKNIGVVALCMMFLSMFLADNWFFMKFDQSLLWVELAMIGVTLIYIGRKGWQNNCSIILICFYVSTFSYAFFNNYHSVYERKSFFNEYSIVHNEHANRVLDEYLNTLPNKEIYRYVYINSKEPVPIFIPSNFSWYHTTQRKTSNYLGYPLHEYISQEYMFNTMHSHFYEFNWKYLLTSRADFIIIDADSLKKNKEFLDQVIDKRRSFVPLWGELMICSLKKFKIDNWGDEICNYKEDNVDSLDNGYFYSGSFRNDNILNANDNGANYFSIKVNVEKDGTISFLPAWSKYLHMYVDGQEIQVSLDNKVATVYIPAGVHLIEVKYINIFEKIAFYTIMCFYLLCITFFIIKNLNGKYHRLLKE